MKITGRMHIQNRKDHIVLLLNEIKLGGFLYR